MVIGYWYSLATSTQRAYSSVQRAFRQFCQDLQVPAMPAEEQVLLLYIADLSQRVCYSTAQSYSSAIRHIHLSHGLPDPLQSKPRLDLALKCLKRQRPSTTNNTSNSCCGWCAASGSSHSCGQVNSPCRLAQPLTHRSTSLPGTWQSIAGRTHLCCGSTSKRQRRTGPE